MIVVTELIELIPPDTIFEIAFGLIISVVLFIVDNRGKKRQEETLRRTDESIDIILEQVSKVNLFQTRTLSLAIETLGNDFQVLREEIDDLRTSVEEQGGLRPKVASTELGSSDTSDRPRSPEVEDEPSKPLLPDSALSSLNFGDILSGQINSMVDNIRKELQGVLSGKSQEDEEETYRKKKGLEFDLRDLLGKRKLAEELQKARLARDELRRVKDEAKKAVAHSSEEPRSEIPSKPSPPAEPSVPQPPPSTEDIGDLFRSVNSTEELEELAKGILDNLEGRFSAGEVKIDLGDLIQSTQKAQDRAKARKDRKKVQPTRKTSQTDKSEG